MTELDEGESIDAKLIPRTATQAKEAIKREAEFRHEAIRLLRESAYATETDPIAFKVIRGEATQEEYIAAVEAVKTRFPYPTNE